MESEIIEANLSLCLLVHRPTLPDTSLQPGVDKTSNPGRHEARLPAIITRHTAPMMDSPFPTTDCGCRSAVIDEIQGEVDG